MGGYTPFFNKRLRDSMCYPYPSPEPVDPHIGLLIEQFDAREMPFYLELEGVERQSVPAVFVTRGNPNNAKTTVVFEDGPVPEATHWGIFDGLDGSLLFWAELKPRIHSCQPLEFTAGTPTLVAQANG